MSWLWVLHQEELDSNQCIEEDSMLYIKVTSLCGAINLHGCISGQSRLELFAYFVTSSIT